MPKTEFNLMTKKPTKKNIYDKTCTERQSTYLERLTDGGGKAVRIDFNGDDLKMLDELVANGGEGSRAEVVRVLVRKANWEYNTN